MAAQEKCPHCGQDALAATATTKTDTSDVKVKVWKCSACKYSEGRPIKGV